MKFGLEILARQQRRTASAVIEMLLDQAIDKSLIEQTWHPSEAIRALKLSLTLHSRQLLTYEEEQTLKLLPVVFDGDAIKALTEIALRPASSLEPATLLVAINVVWQPLKTLASQSNDMTDASVLQLQKLASLTRQLLQGELTAAQFTGQLSERSNQ